MDADVIDPGVFSRSVSCPATKPLTWDLTVNHLLSEGTLSATFKEFAVEVLVLLACLSGTLAMIAALVAFILARADGKTVHVAVREAGVAFIAGVTLAILLLNFVGVGSSSRPTPPQPAPASSAYKG